MKRILLTVLLLACFKFLIAQEYSEVKKDYFDLYVDLGYKSAVIDFISGPIIGLSIYNPDKPFCFSYRNDFLISLGKHTYIDSTNQIQVSSNKFEILQFITQSNFEFGYRLPYLKGKPLTLGTGLGWINLGDRENVRFNKDYGYMTLSISIKYKLSWFLIELKGDIAFKNDYYNLYRYYDKPIPVSLGLIYRFKPKNNE